MGFRWCCLKAYGVSLILWRPFLCCCDNINVMEDADYPTFLETFSTVRECYPLRMPLVEFLPTRIEVSYTQQLHTTHRKTRVSTVLCTSYCIYVWYYPCTEVSSGQTIYLSSHTHAIGCRWPRALPCSGNPVRSCLRDALLLWIVYHTKAFTKTA